MIGLGPGAAPAGTRSLGFDLAGGNAVGALFTVDSMLVDRTASLAVNAAGRTTGVAYAGYQEPADAGTTLLWLGRSELVDPGRCLADRRRDDPVLHLGQVRHDHAASGSPPGPASRRRSPAFAAAHGGDGPGVYTIGFGCDGTPFSMDEMRVGAPVRSRPTTSRGCGRW